jgi:hypothetical protein
MAPALVHETATSGDARRDPARLYQWFIGMELDFYFALVIRAGTERSRGHRKAARQSRALAETGYATLQRYLSDPARMELLAAGQRDELTAKMIAFREALDGLRAAWTNETISALAYQLWLDRGCPLGSPEEDWFRAEEVLKSFLGSAWIAA